MNPYLEQLIRDCKVLADNAGAWIETADYKMLEGIVLDIEKDIMCWKSTRSER